MPEPSTPQPLPAPPRPRAMPLLGSLPGLLRGQYRYFERVFAQQGGVFELDLCVTSVLIVADADAAEAVFVTRARNYDKGGEFWDGAREQAGQGLTQSEGELWRRQRRLMQPKFQREAIESYHSLIDSTIRDAIDRLPVEVPIDLGKWCEDLLVVLSLRVLLGSELDAAAIEQVRHAMDVRLDALLRGVVLRKLPRWLPQPGRARLAHANATIEATLSKLIARVRERGPGNDLLSALLIATDEEGTMSDAQLRDEAVVIFGAGFETTASTLAWALWLLATHEHVLADVQREIDAEGEERPLLRACVHEALRLYPPGALIPRRAVADDELGGYAVRAGTSVIVAPWLIHRDPRWWPQPERFDPLRFMAPADRPRAAFIPFGAGQRLCIGKALALLELELALVQLLARFTPLVPSGTPSPEPCMGTTIKPSVPIMLSLQPRR